MPIRLGILFLAMLIIAACATPAATLPPTAPRNQPGAAPDTPTSPTVTPAQVTPSPTGNMPVSNQTPASQTPARSPYEPRVGDEKLTRAPVYLDQSDVLLLESLPVQASLRLKGNLPSPCHELRAKVMPADAQHRVNVEAYSLVAPDKVCPAMLQPFEANIALGNFASGKYTVWVNGEKVAEFNV